MDELVIACLVEYQNEPNQNFGNILKIWLVFGLVSILGVTLEILVTPMVLFPILGQSFSGQIVGQKIGVVVVH